MKLTTFIDKNHEEEVLIYSKERTNLVLEIEKLVKNNNTSINAIKDNEIFKLNPFDVCCFVSENNKVFALVDDEKYVVRERLYQLEEILSDSFIKINQSCFANIKRIEKFSSTIGGSLMVHFENGYCDYIARREVKKVKERMGI